MRVYSRRMPPKNEKPCAIMIKEGLLNASICPACARSSLPQLSTGLFCEYMAHLRDQRVTFFPHVADPR